MKSMLAIISIYLLIGAYSTKDINIEIDFANSESQSTDIIISQEGEDIEINIWSEETVNDDGSEISSAGIIINDPSGSETSPDDATITIDTYVDENTTTVDISYNDRDGDYADLGYAQSTSSNENSTTSDILIYYDAGRVSEEEDWAYNETTNEWDVITYTEETVYSQDYFYSSTETSVNDDGSVSETTVTVGNIEGYGFVATEEATVTDDGYGGGSKSVDKEVVWWVNTQQEIINALGSISILTWIAFSSIALVVIFLVYKKMTSRKQIVHAASEYATSYIRI